MFRYSARPPSASHVPLSTLSRLTSDGQAPCSAIPSCESRLPGGPGEVPYILGQVELPAGPQVLAEVIDCQHSDLTIGMPVELAIQAVPAQEGGEDKLVYKWRPASV